MLHLFFLHICSWVDVKHPYHFPEKLINYKRKTLNVCQFKVRCSCEPLGVNYNKTTSHIRSYREQKYFYRFFNTLPKREVVHLSSAKSKVLINHFFYSPDKKITFVSCPLPEGSISWYVISSYIIPSVMTVFRRRVHVMLEMWVVHKYLALCGTLGLLSLHNMRIFTLISKKKRRPWTGKRG